MKQQPSKKAIMISAVLTALILIGMAGVSLTKQGWSLAMTNPFQLERVQIAGLDSSTADGLDAQMAADQTTALDPALDPALEAALDAALDPNMDPALKDSLKSALRSALAPQTFSASTGKQPPIVVTVEPIYMAGQQQAAASGGQWSGQAVAPAQVSAPAVAQAAVTQAGVDQVAAAYQAQLEQAYAALQDAYTQIDTLQTGQSATTNVSYSGGHDDHDGGDHDGGGHDGGDHDGGGHDGEHDGGDHDGEHDGGDHDGEHDDD